MGHTNETTNLHLPQFIGSDKPTWLGDINGAFQSIDSAYATIEASASGAVSTANNAATVAQNASDAAASAQTAAGGAATDAATAISTANNAAETANNAQSTAVLAKNEADEAYAAAVRGEVSVTADGVKTNAQIFGEVAALLDYSKLTNNSALRIGNTVYRIMNINLPANTALFATHALISTNVSLVQCGISTTPANCYLHAVDIGSGTPPTWAYTDTSASVPTNGTVFTITY